MSRRSRLSRRGPPPALLAAGAVLWLLATRAAPAVHAHGGSYYPPKPVAPTSPAPPPGSTPYGGNDPYREPPPPKRPPTTPTGVPPPSPTTPPAGPGGGVTGPASGPAPTGPLRPPETPEAPGTREGFGGTGGGEAPGVGPGGRRGTGATAGPGEESWETWWLLNRWALLPDRDAARRRAEATPVTPTGVGAAGSDAVAGWERDREVAARERVLPFLRSVLDPGSGMRDDVVASALLATGRAARDGTAVALLWRHAEDDRASALVRESAALSLGLLRRDRPAEQMGGADLDRLRERLLGLLDDRRAPERTRAFAALSLGLLGDQPFGDAFSRDGRLVVRGLWDRLGYDAPGVELTVAMLTALGMQPGAGVPEGVREGLHAVVLGKRVHGRPWSGWERSHALTALARLGGPGCDILLLRTLRRRGADAPLRRAALLALGARAEALAPEDRAEALAAAVRAAEGGSDPLSAGLARVTVGRLLGAARRSADPASAAADAAEAFLLGEARSGPTPTRGFGAVALALSLRGVAADTRETLAARVEAERVLLAGLAGPGDGRARAAYAVALGLLEARGAVEALVLLVEDRRAEACLRGHAAVALGQIGRRGPESARALHLLLAERSSEELRREAALALSLLGERSAVLRLVRELESGVTERLLAQVAVALGRLDALAAVDPLLAVARDGTRGELTQALAVVSLGLLVDPSPRGSLLRLTVDANYPARTDALHEVFTIL